MGLALFLESRSSPPLQRSQTLDAERPRCALRSRGPHQQKFEAGLEGASRNRHERFPMQLFHAIAPLRKRHREYKPVHTAAPYGALFSINVMNFPLSVTIAQLVP